jgi:hypothetical protein
MRELSVAKANATTSPTNLSKKSGRHALSKNSNFRMPLGYSRVLTGRRGRRFCGGRARGTARDLSMQQTLKVRQLWRRVCVVVRLCGYR